MDPTQEQEKKPSTFTIILLLILVGIILGGTFLYLNTTYPNLFKESLNNFNAQIATKPESQSTLQTPPPIITNPTPSINKIPIELPTGPQTYTFSHGDQVKGPKISKIIFDPLSIQPGETQTITLFATYHVDITKVSIEMLTDNKVNQLELTRISGNNLDGSWQTVWTPEDTINHKYGARLLLNSKEETYDNTMWFK